MRALHTRMVSWSHGSSDTVHGCVPKTIRAFSRSFYSSNKSTVSSWAYRNKVRASLGALLLVTPATASCGLGPREEAHLVGTLQERNDSPSQASSSSLSTISAASPSLPATTIEFDPPDNATACHSLAFHWQSNTLTAPLTLIVTNDRTLNGAHAGLSNDVLVSRTIAADIPPSASQVVWNPVDVPQGAYIITAHDASRVQLGILSQSPPFFVFAEDRPTCSFTTVDNTTSSEPGLPPTTSTLPTFAGGSGASVSPSAVTGSQTKGMSSGGIGGMVAGIVVAVVLLLLAFGLLYYRRKNSAPGRPRNPRVGGLYYLF
ncbi:hypothetical protein C8Q79DRAFT_565838 [Trametes meyenii]|nr:hypothetical protein C8Q79DRAFT_565838 [Trametes meyenii]